MAAHDILLDAAEQADPDSAVVMLAEAAEACLLRARAGADAARPRGAAWDAHGPDCRRARAFFARARARHGADLQRAAARRAPSCCARPTRSLERSDALTAIRSCCRSAAARRRCGCARRADGRALVGRAIAYGRAARARSARCPYALVAGRPRRGDERTLGGRRVAVRGGDPARARDRAGDRAVCRARGAGAASQARRADEEACRAHAAQALALAEPAAAWASSRLWALEALGRARARARATSRRRSAAGGEGAPCSAEHGIADPDVVAGARADRGAAAPRARHRGRAAAERLRAGGRGQGPALVARAAGAGPRAARRRRTASTEALRLHARDAGPLRGGAHALCHGETAAPRAPARGGARAVAPGARRVRRPRGRAVGRARPRRARGERRDRAPARRRARSTS